MFVSGMCSMKRGVALGAMVVAAGMSLSAQAATVSPGGSVTLSGPISISLSSSPTFGGKTQTASCTLIIDGVITPRTGDILVSSARLNSDCGSGTAAHFYIDQAQLPRTFHIDDVLRSTVMYDSSLDVKATPWIGFSPPAVVTCWAPFPNLLWYADLLHPGPSDQVRATGGVTFDNASDGGTCLGGGLLTAAPAQTFYP